MTHSICASRVSAKDLSLLAPDSRGTLEGNGTIRGTPNEPIVAATLHGNGIQHEGVTHPGPAG